MAKGRYERTKPHKEGNPKWQKDVMNGQSPM